MVISGASVAAVAAVQRCMLSAGWVKVSPGTEPESYEDDGGAPIETGFCGLLTSISATEAEDEGGVQDKRQLYRLLADRVELTPEDQVRHNPTSRLFEVLALASPPTGTYGGTAVIVAEIP